MFSILNKHVFLTGGSSGIGLEIALRFKAAGANVTVFDINSSSELDKQGIRQIQGSVTSEEALAAALRSSCESYGPLDVLINNAGIAGEELPLSEACLEDLQKVLDINLSGVLLGLKHGAAHMRSGGSIINTASAAASITMPEYTSYTVSKSGVVRLTQQAALELGERNIRVNAVCPGTTTTPMEPADSPESRICRYTTALGRPGRPEEQAAVYQFLACDESSYITGQAINVDGGWLHGVTPAMGDLLLTSAEH